MPAGESSLVSGVCTGSELSQEAMGSSSCIAGPAADDSENSKTVSLTSTAPFCVELIGKACAELIGDVELIGEACVELIGEARLRLARS